MKLLVLLLTMGCEPVRHALPSDALRYASGIHDDDDLSISLVPVTPHSVDNTPELSFSVHLEDYNQDVILPLVPLPSLQVTVESHGRELLGFAHAQIVLEDDTGHRYRQAHSAMELVPLVLDQQLGREDTDLPRTALATHVANVPLLGPDVVVLPGGHWVGAIALLDEGVAPETLAARLHGNLMVSLSGIRVGDRELAPMHFQLPMKARADSLVCADGAQVPSPDRCRVDGYLEWQKDGPCIQVETVGRWIGGTRVGQRDLDETLRGVDESRPAAARARRMRAAGYALIVVGAIGAGVVGGAIAGTGHGEEAPAAMSVLAITGLGMALNHLARRSEAEAIRSYNRYAFRTGVCAPPL